MAPFPPPCPFSFAEVLFSGCTQSLLRHMVSFQVAISYLCLAKVICQGTSRHLLGLRLNVNSLVVSSLSRGDDPHGGRVLSFSASFWVSFLHRAYIFSVICLFPSCHSLSYYCKTTLCQELCQALGNLIWSSHSHNLHSN